ncbi:hypothetical protein Fmac_027438 [Flemingia macrophylla]|uniref:Uncharacterized protein n=1 Tax=Flemingia macrophylla TaxID=520843 RepID=A0ABD1LHQ2_9FABA
MGDGTCSGDLCSCLCLSNCLNLLVRLLFLLALFSQFTDQTAIPQKEFYLAYKKSKQRIKCKG